METLISWQEEKMHHTN